MELYIKYGHEQSRRSIIRSSSSMSNQQLRWSNKRSWRSSSRRRISRSRAVVERRPATVEGGVAVGQ